MNIKNTLNANNLGVGENVYRNQYNSNYYVQISNTNNIEDPGAKSRRERSSQQFRVSEIKKPKIKNGVNNGTKSMQTLPQINQTQSNTKNLLENAIK